MSASQTRAMGPKLPSAAALRRATAETAARLKDPNADIQEIYRAAEREAATLHAFWQTHGNQAKAELETEPEAVAG
jgi:hypothetical protein